MTVFSSFVGMICSCLWTLSWDFPASFPNHSLQEKKKVSGKCL